MDRSEKKIKANKTQCDENLTRQNHILRSKVLLFDLERNLDDDVISKTNRRTSIVYLKSD